MVEVGVGVVVEVEVGVGVVVGVEVVVEVEVEVVVEVGVVVEVEVEVVVEVVVEVGVGVVVEVVVEVEVEVVLNYMKKDKVKSMAGKKGAQATYRKRYEMLDELRKYVNPSLYVFLPKWPTTHLEALLKAYKN